LALDERMVFDAFVRAGFADMTSCGLPARWSARCRMQTEEPSRACDACLWLWADPSRRLQLAQAYLMLANDGIRLPISILRRDATPKGERNVRPRCGCCDRADDEGCRFGARHGAKARVVGYEIAGKTGTARKVGPNGYDDERHVAFFAGLAPADDPRVWSWSWSMNRKAKNSAAAMFGRPVYCAVM